MRFNPIFLNGYGLRRVPMLVDRSDETLFRAGLILDTWFNAMFDAGWFELPPEWDTNNVTSFLMRLFYFGCIAICIYGMVVLVVTIYHKYVLDEDEDEDDEDEIGSSTYIGGNI